MKIDVAYNEDKIVINNKNGFYILEKEDSGEYHLYETYTDENTTYYIGKFMDIFDCLRYVKSFVIKEK